jgi:hypothetical protein
MANFQFSFDGLEAMRQKIQQAASNLPVNAGAALYQFGEEVMAVSKERVPVDTGRLMNTGYVALPVQDGNVISVVLGYDTDYALQVHEDLDPRTHWKRPGSGPKFLENPLKEAEGQMAGELGGAIQTTLAA